MSDETPDVTIELKTQRISEYLIVSDINSKIILSSTDYNKIRKQAKLIREAGGQVTVFKSLEA